MRHQPWRISCKYRLCIVRDYQIPSKGSKKNLACEDLVDIFFRNQHFFGVHSTLSTLPSLSRLTLNEIATSLTAFVMTQTPNADYPK